VTAADVRHCFTGVKVFSSTLADDRARMGEKIVEWLRTNPDLEVVDQVVTQSSDAAYHCVAITLFFRRRS
jgi:hypothetical protein